MGTGWNSKDRSLVRFAVIIYSHYSTHHLFTTNHTNPQYLIFYNIFLCQKTLNQVFWKSRQQQSLRQYIFEYLHIQLHPAQTSYKKQTWSLCFYWFMFENSEVKQEKKKKKHSILGMCMFTSKLRCSLLRKSSAGKIDSNRSQWYQKLLHRKKNCTFSGSYLQVTVQIDSLVAHNPANYKVKRKIDIDAELTVAWEKIY